MDSRDTPLPERIESEAALEQLLSLPSPRLVELARSWPDVIVIVGAGGKMGPTLSWMARRAADCAGARTRIIAASRFTDPNVRRWLEERGVLTVPCDLLDRAAVRDLPDASLVLSLAGLKFGTQVNPALTWAANTLIPAHLTERYAGARIVAMSTGNVYPFVPAGDGGATESSPLTPVGEYANAAIARERLFEYGARRGQSPLLLLRLNYAVELRYGVLVDIASRLYSGAPIRLETGAINCIWQGDASDTILRGLSQPRGPVEVLNLTGPALSVREVAEKLGKMLNKEPQFVGRESGTALLSDASEMCRRFGPPAVPIARVMEWTADWVMRGRPIWNKPTGFEIRDGNY